MHSSQSTYWRRRVGIHKLRLLRLGDFQNGLNFRAAEDKETI
jgi:hypothetical protein